MSRRLEVGRLRITGRSRWWGGRGRDEKRALLLLECLPTLPLPPPPPAPSPPISSSSSSSCSSTSIALTVVRSPASNTVYGRVRRRPRNSWYHWSLVASGDHRSLRTSSEVPTGSSSWENRDRRDTWTRTVLGSLSRYRNFVERIRKHVRASESDICVSFRFSVFQRHDIARKSIIGDSGSIHRVLRECWRE